MKNIPSIQQMRAFQTLYELGSVSETARQLCVTQPAITSLIKDLEVKLGTQLFKRTTRKLERTEAAHEANRYISRVMRDLHELCTNLKSDSPNLKQIKIVSTTTVTQTFLAPIMKEFLGLYPDITLHLQECQPADFYNYLLQHDADIAIGASINHIDGYHINDLFNDALVVFGKNEYLDAYEKCLPWSALVQCDLVLVKAGYGIRDLIDKIFTKVEIMDDVNIVQQVTLLNTAISLAKAGLGITIIPESIAKYFSDTEHSYRVLSEPHTTRTISLVHAKAVQTDHYLYDFIEFIKKRTPQLI
jgi:LysR family transcriptional regulator, carnitine catabolism transcriptional activator